MNIKQSLIANRMNVSFILLIVLMLSCAPLVLSNEIVWAGIPVTVAILLVVWIIYSSIAKQKMIENEIISNNHSDIVEDLDKVFKPKSKIKTLLAAYGLSIAIMILLLGSLVAISPETLTKNASGFSFSCVFVIAYVISYFIIRKRIT